MAKKAALSIKQFTDLAGKIVEGIPEKYLKHLNGGFNVAEDEVRDGEYLIMGEYVYDDILGSTIMLYYGSFVSLLEGAGPDEWKSELKETILHELRHHIENMAGVDYLGVEELEELYRDRLKNRD